MSEVGYFGNHLPALGFDAVRHGNSQKKLTQLQMALFTRLEDLPAEERMMIWSVVMADARNEVRKISPASSLNEAYVQFVARNIISDLLNSSETVLREDIAGIQNHVYGTVHHWFMRAQLDADNPSAN